MPKPQSGMESRVESLYKTYKARSDPSGAASGDGAAANAAKGNATTAASGVGGQGEKDKEQEIKKRRREQLRWREVDYELDRLRVSRDFLQWFKYVRNGQDYALDCELERELRYFPEHVAKELKRFPKFLTGTSKLTSTNVPFPTLTNLTKLSSASAATSLEQDKLLPTSFKVPTVVFMSQFVHEMPEAPDIIPQYASLLSAALAAPAVTGKSSASEKRVPSSVRIEDVVAQEIVARNYEEGTSQFEVLFLKTVDFQSSIWMRNWLSRLYGRRMPVEMAERTFVGKHAIRSFGVDSIGLRNYGAHYVMLVDHKGAIRWISTGMPTEQERKWFIDHVHTLIRQHVVAKSTK